ncbi:hypothetical protein [Hwanghaeella sp.]|uniref:hypothetical protein n=1 Tax=Hwanghaeella sp. TaxID=2605943 RepID=UPI003CCBFCAA
MAAAVVGIVLFVVMALVLGAFDYAGFCLVLLGVPAVLLGLVAVLASEPVFAIYLILGGGVSAAIGAWLLFKSDRNL